MRGALISLLSLAALSSQTQTSSAPQGPASTPQNAVPAQQWKLSAKMITEGEQLYARYCATCHGKDREGHITEHANSLRTKSFLHTVNPALLDYAIRYGRPHTAMAAFSEAMGGPLNDNQIKALNTYIISFDNSPRAREPAVTGDIERGKTVYAERCQTCHGPDGGGAMAPSLNDLLFLTASSPYFIRVAVAEGREGTSMQAFSSDLTPRQIDDVAVYITSWMKTWIKPDPVHLVPTDLSAAIINPKNPSPSFGPLREDRYVTPAALKQAVDAALRLVILDVRPMSEWGGGHIPGAAPLPYYDLEKKMAELPQDGTWIVAYCSCPVHLANQAVDALRAKGFKNVAALDEGFAGWIGRGFPVQSGILPTTSSK